MKFGMVDDSDDCISFRFEKCDWAELQRVADEMGIKRSELLNRIVSEGLERLKNATKQANDAAYFEEMKRRQPK